MRIVDLIVTLGMKKNRELSSDALSIADVQQISAEHMVHHILEMLAPDESTIISKTCDRHPSDSRNFFNIREYVGARNMPPNSLECQERIYYCMMLAMLLIDSLSPNFTTFEIDMIEAYLSQPTAKSAHELLYQLITSSTVNRALAHRIIDITTHCGRIYAVTIILSECNLDLNDLTHEEKSIIDGFISHA
jgi:hypothetical protein